MPFSRFTPTTAHTLLSRRAVLRAATAGAAALGLPSAHEA
ncbi:twin-arginine translocation signal domain-containing protein [Comamonas serinivorans]|nr:twin-arginine translocation signal domain-containing protein [Comamonas serinivorans]